jgi:hypothetical protein
MPPIPSGFGQVSYVFTGEGAGPGGCMVTLGVDHDFLDSLSVLAQELHDAFDDNIMGILSPAVTLEETRLRIATPAGEIVTSVFGGNQGGGTGQNSPPNVSWPVLKYSAFGGRANRGRWFLPGMNGAQVTSSGAITGDAQDAMNDALTAYLVALAADDWTPVILHGEPESGPPTPEPTVILSMLSGTRVYTRATRLRS